MKIRLQKEIIVALQYLAFASVALIMPYLRDASIPGINTTEVWKNFAPYVKLGFVTFVVLATIRLLLVIVFSYIRGVRRTNDS